MVPSPPLRVATMTKTSAVHPAVGRSDVVDLVNHAVIALRKGQGGTIWVEGEAGIGKTTVLSSGLASNKVYGCVLRWAVADERGQHVPLRPLLDAFGEDASVTSLLTEAPSSLWAFGESVPAAAERMISLVEEWAAAAPQVLVLDDIQWADQASLRVWWRLARISRQAPLLVVASGRPSRGQPDVLRLRDDMAADGRLISLTPLLDEQVVELAEQHLGRVTGPRLRRFLDAAAGNPLYVQELVDALLRDGSIVDESGTAELPPSHDASVPPSLIAAVTARLAVLSPPGHDLVSRAAVLGSEFSISDLATVMKQSPSAMAEQIEEATLARVLTATGAKLQFRHPVIQRALYDDLSEGAKLALHRAAGQALAGAAAAVERVAAQVLAAQAIGGEQLDPWAFAWLVGESARLGQRAPELAVQLLDRVIGQFPRDPHMPTLDLALARLLFRLNRPQEWLTHAERAIGRAASVGQREELTWVTAASLLRLGRIDELLAMTENVLREVEETSLWRGRLLGLVALGLNSKDLDLASSQAQLALELGQRSQDVFAIALACHSHSLVAAYRNDNRAVVELTTRALDAVGNDPQYPNLCLIIVHNRLLAWLNLDADAEAATDLATIRSMSERAGLARMVHASISASEYYYRVGRWDDALAELDALAEEGAATSIVTTFVRNGVSALVAAHRDDWPTAETFLSAMSTQDISNASERNNAGYMLMARSTWAEAQGDLELAATTLARTLEPAFATGMHLRYLWLPNLTRLALAVNDQALAQAAAQACAEEVATESTTGKTAAAARCAGLVAGDVGPVLKAAETYRELGRNLDLGQTLEDAAVLLAPHDRDRAREAYVEAVDAYASLGALWDIRRADARLRPLGLRRPGRAAVARPTTGWAALSPTELTVAHQVALNRSNAAIAAELFVSRRTVECHVTHILAKLGAHSRAAIARHVADNDPTDGNGPHWPRALRRA